MQAFDPIRNVCAAMRTKVSYHEFVSAFFTVDRLVYIEPDIFLGKMFQRNLCKLFSKLYWLLLY